MRAFIRDVRYAVRSWRRAPTLAASIVVILGLGVGVNSAVFALVDQVLLRDLAYADPDRLVRVTADLTRLPLRDVGVSVPELLDLRRSGIFDDVAGLLPVSANLTETDEPERVQTLLADASYFQVLGARPAVGRLFGAQDAEPGITEVAVISDGLWRRRYGADPSVVGRRLRLDDDLYTIVGVTEASFRHPARGAAGDVDVWAPDGFLGRPHPNDPPRTQRLLTGAIGRLRAGVTPAEAQRRLDTLASDLRAKYANDYPDRGGWTLRSIGLHDDVVGDVRPALLVLLAAVGFVLAIVCVNVANLLLARASSRGREIAIRCAIGAGRGTLVRQLLTESLVLATVGGVVGVGVAAWTIDVVVALAPVTLPRVGAVHVDWSVLLFTAAVSVATGVLFGLAPAFHVRRADDVERLLRESSHGVSGNPRAARLRSALVIAECALAVVLLVAASLLVRSFVRLLHVDPGFKPARVLTAGIWLPAPNDRDAGVYLKPENRVVFFRQVADRLAALPGVEAVGIVGILPLGGGPFPLTRVTIEGRPPESGPLNASEITFATPGYFPAMGIELRRGRSFGDHDDARGVPVCVVNTTFARRYFANLDPIGQRVRFGGGPQPPWITIVGVVGDVRTTALELEPRPQAYRPLNQQSNLGATIAVRTRTTPSALAGAIGREVRTVDPSEPVFAVRPMEQVVARATAERRFAMVLVAIFAVVALLLAAIGIYAVMTYAVGQRAREIGIRVALGATGQRVIWMVVRQAVTLTVAGVLVGLAGALATTHWLSSLLFGISARDPISYLAIGGLLIAVSIAASTIPARRAARVDPLVALRVE
jgi:predicted permease